LDGVNRNRVVSCAGMDAGPKQSAPVLSFDRGTLLLSGTSARIAIDAARGAWAWDDRVPAWRCDAIQYQCVRREFTQRPGLTIRDEVPQSARVLWPKVDLPAHRRHAGPAGDSRLLDAGVPGQ